jgi:DNA-binding transcriptional LysR family regulator
MQLSERIGRRLKLQDLHVLMVVVEAGSMGKAAQRLNTTQPAVSRSIAQLEHALGVRLLDRSTQGIAPTKYGHALLDGGVEIFDDFRQLVKNIEFLSNPTVGDVTVGGNEYVTAGLLPAVLRQVRGQHPGIALHATPMHTVMQQYTGLRERKIDLFIGRIPQLAEPDINCEILFYERTFVVAGPQSKWARRRKIMLSELANEPWSMPPPDTLVRALVVDAFRKHGVEFPPRGAATGTILLTSALMASGQFLGILPRSMLHFGTGVQSFKVLPVDLQIPPWPVGVMTLKKRTLSPVVKLFIDFTRQVAKPLSKLSR